MSSVVTPKSRAMVGSATLTMLVSSTDMNMPPTSTNIGTSQVLRPPLAGRATATDASGTSSSVT